MKSIKVRIYPNKEQIHFLNGQFGAVRMIYNKGIAIISNRYKKHNERVSAFTLKKLLPIAKKSRKYHWLKLYDSLALQESLRNLDKAFKDFYKIQKKYPKIKNKKGKPYGFPRFKSRYDVQHSYHCSNVSYCENSIKIPKLGNIKAKIHRNIPSDLSSITISRSLTGKYYASLTLKPTEQEVPLLKKVSSSKVVGLDIGISNLLANSNHETIDNPRFLKRATRNLRRKQKQLSRKKKGTASRNKARLLVAKCHEKISNARNHFQHTLSKTIIDESQAVIVETLKVKNMLKNKKLAKHISDASWSMLLEKIAYKAKQAGKHFKKINQWYASSKTCHKCQSLIAKLTLDIRKWQCTNCDATHDRDINAAINIKLEGLKLLITDGIAVTAS
jgi:putative transposase